MKNFDERKFYEGQIEFYKRMIGYAENSLEFNKRQLKRGRKHDRELVEYVWSRGVVTEWEMRLFHKNYKSEEVKKLEKEARYERKRIRKYRKDIEKYEAMLAEC